MFPWIMMIRLNGNILTQRYWTSNRTTGSRLRPEIGIHPRPIRVRCTGVCWRVASRRPDGTQHEYHDENSFGEQPGKTSVTKDLLYNEKENGSDERSS